MATTGKSPGKGGVLSPAVVIALGKAPGKGSAGAPMAADSGYGPPGDTELAAASQLIAAIKAGNPEHVVEAYRAIKEACMAAENAPAKGGGGGY